MIRVTYLVLCLLVLLSACAAPAAQPIRVPTAASALQAGGGGDPRTPGYWLLWNTCAEGNQSAVAKANGGRAAGYLLLDDLLEKPGVLVGRVGLTGCQPAVSLLKGLDLAGNSVADDPAYALAAQLLAAQLNLAAGSRTCTSADDAVQKAQLLLVTANFRGSGAVLGPMAAADQRSAAATLTARLREYNLGSLCR